MDSLSLAADFFAELRFARRTADEIPAEFRPRNPSTAYAIQEALITRLLARHGGHPIGYKIGATNASVQKLLNTPTPVYGRLLSSFVYPSPARLKASAFTILGVETEFAFEIAKDVPEINGRHTPETIVEYIGEALPAIEVVGHRLSDWSKFDALSLIADNVLNEAWIPGVPSGDWQALDLANHAVRLLVNGKVTLTSRGEAVLGHPLNALAWLVNELTKWGRSLKAGEFVTTGTCTDIYVAKAGDKIQADFGTLGSVELAFEGG